MPEIKHFNILDDYFPREDTIHKNKNLQERSLPTYKRPKSQSIAIQVLLEEKPRPSSKKDFQASPPFQTDKEKIPPEVQKALNNLLPAEAAHYLGEKVDVFDTQYQADQAASKRKYDGFAGSMKYYGIITGQKLLDWATTFVANKLFQSVGSHIGVVLDPMVQFTNWDESRLKKKHHTAQSKESEFIGKKVLENSELTVDELKKIKDTRLVKIKENHELERLLGKLEIPADRLFDKQNLLDLIQQNPTLGETHTRLLEGFINGLNLEDNKIAFSDLQDEYAKHTVGISLMARNALITQNAIKNQTEKKIFEWENTSNGLQFNISLAAAVTWFTLNILIWAGVGISSSAIPALGYAALGIGCALSLIGLGVLAYRAPHQFIEVMKLTYIRKSLNWMKSYTIKTLLGNNKESIKQSTLHIKQLQERLLAIPKITPEEYNQLSDNEKEKYVFVDDRNVYVISKTYSKLETEIKNEERKINRIEKRLSKVSKDSAYYTDKITQAKIKDHQRTHRMFEKVGNKTQYIDSFMDEVALIAANDISRHTDDKLAEDLSALLVRQYGVAIAGKKDEQITPAELHQSIKKGIEYFVGADNDRINKINMRLRHSKKSAHRMVIHSAIHSPRLLPQAQQILKKYNLDVNPLERDTPKNRNIQTETLRRTISNHLPKDEAMVLYGELWNLVRSHNGTQ